MKETKMLDLIAEKIKKEEQKINNNKFNTSNSFLDFSKLKICLPKNYAIDPESRLKIKTKMKTSFSIQPLPDISYKINKHNKEKIHKKNNKFKVINNSCNFLFIINEQTTMINNASIVDKIIFKTLRNFNSLRIQIDSIYNEANKNVNLPQSRYSSSDYLFNKIDLKGINKHLSFNKKSKNFNHEILIEYEIKKINKNFDRLFLYHYDQYEFDKFALTLDKLKNFLRLNEIINRISKNLISRNLNKNNHLIDYSNNNLFFIVPNNKDKITKFESLIDTYFQYSLTPNYKRSKYNVNKEDKIYSNFNFLYIESNINIFINDFYKIPVGSFNNFNKRYNKKLINKISHNFYLNKYKILELPDIKIKSNKRLEDTNILKKESNHKLEINISNSPSKQNHSPIEESSFTIYINTNKILNTISKNILKELLTNLNLKDVSNILIESKTHCYLLNGIDFILNLNTACILINPLDFVDEYDSKFFQEIYDIIKKNYLSYEKILIVVFQYNMDASDYNTKINKLFNLLQSFIDRNCVIFMTNSNLQIGLYKINKIFELVDFIIVNSHLAITDFINYSIFSEYLIDSSERLSLYAKKLPLLNFYELNVLNNIKSDADFDLYFEFIEKKYKNKSKIDKEFIKNIWINKHN